MTERKSECSYGGAAVLEALVEDPHLQGALIHRHVVCEGPIVVGKADAKLDDPNDSS
jgi:hypothetical protein